MHLHKFADLVSFEEIAVGGTLPETEYYRDFFKRLHPAQLLSSRVRIPIYEVTYSYNTKRGNYHVGKKYVFCRREHEDLDIEIVMLLRDWVEDINKWKPYRKIFNVKILEIKPIAYALLSIGF